MALTKTKIEYLDYGWSFYTGCKHDKTVCPVADKCWARGMSHRFSRSFEPTLHPEKLLDPLSLKKPARIGVCFTGDLFGDWVDTEQIIVDPFRFKEFENNTTSLKDAVFEVINDCPQHQFFFLTKAPQNYQKWGKFPDNAWIGATVCNEDMMNKAFNTFCEINPPHVWLSIEPLMGKIDCSQIEAAKYYRWVDWVVIGGWSGNKNSPPLNWVWEIIDACNGANIPVFLKSNLGGIAKDFQELPKEG